MPAKKKPPCPKACHGQAPKSAKRKLPGKASWLAKGGALYTLTSVGGVSKPDRGAPAARAVQGMAVPVSWATRPTKTG